MGQNSATRLGLKSKEPPNGFKAAPKPATPQACESKTSTRQGFEAHESLPSNSQAHKVASWKLAGPQSRFLVARRPAKHSLVARRPTKSLPSSSQATKSLPSSSQKHSLARKPTNRFLAGPKIASSALAGLPNRFLAAPRPPKSLPGSSQASFLLS